MTIHTPPYSEEMYGCDIAAFIASVEQLPTFELAGPGMVLMSLLSDAQDLMEHGRLDLANQYINRVKYLLCHYHLGLKHAVIL